MTNMLKMSVTIFMFSFLLQLVVSNSMAIKTRELNVLNEQVQDLENQISAVNQQIYSVSSIAGMEEKAKAVGFTQMTQPVKSVSSPAIARAF